ncbi:MAG TPA: CusA/CzcA family heavy metal efflux RND transporter [Thermoanaerobaculia bacterium]|nr:CusA/CzcA family heavy metal efflux RND transporter [Thermoanaerobaculia bacterium]
MRSDGGQSAPSPPGGGQPGGPIERVIDWSASNPWLTILLVAALAVWGWYAMRAGPLDAIPDLSDAQVIIFTEWPGRGPDLIEDQITYPITASLLAAPRVQFVRGQSMFGMSFVYVIFEDRTDIYWARSRVLEYLNEVASRLPDGVVPVLGPDATGVGWVYQYALVDESGGLDLQQLRSLQDWNLRYALESVEGVAEVASIGGFVKEYQILIDPVKLRAFGVPLRDVVQAVRESNQDAGGQSLEVASHEHVVRGRGYVTRPEDLELVPVRVSEAGVPVYLRDLAEVKLGPAPRRGFAELDGRGEAVGGIVIMRYGENALRVIRRVQERLEEVKRSLPEGVEIVPVYDRSELIQASIETLRRTLVEELIIVSVVIFLFLLHARSALVPILTLPIAVLLAFIPMLYQGLTINIMSLGGIAVAIGAMVDASVILIENVHKKLERWEGEGRPGERAAVVTGAMREVGPSLFFSLLVITVSFLPVFTLEGVEGRLFRPLAFTKTYSMAFAALLAVTLTPALAAIFVRGRIRPEERNLLNRWLVRGYTPVVRFVVRFRWTMVILALVAMALTVPAFLQLGSEFMPPLNEGVLLYMPTAPPGMSTTEAQSVLQAMNRELRSFPEVVSVFGKMGRAETATDPAPIGMVETVVVLKPMEEWRQGLSWDDLLREMDGKLRYPGMPGIWWMPIQTRIEMLSTGIRAPLGIKVFGDDLETIERTAVEVERLVAEIPGTRSAFADRSTGGFYVDVVTDRARAARYGLRVADINDVVMSAVGGMAISETVEGRERYPIAVRYAVEYRDRPQALGEVLVATSAGVLVPLGQVADISFTTGPPMIRSEDGRLVGYVFVDPGNRPVADYVAEGRRAVAERLQLAAGVRLEWAGQFTYFERAKARLKVLVPVTLALVVLLLYLNTRSLVETGIVLLAVPFSLIGAVWLLWLLDYNLSVAVWVGLIALAGLDAETGVIMLLYLKIAWRERRDAGRLSTYADLREAIVDGAARRVRPKLMTVLTTMIALVPIMWSTGVGADVMKRIAAPMVGGLATSFLLELTIYPAIFALWKGREVRRRGSGF